MVSIICILGKNRAIGRANKLIWNIPDDLKHFKEITSGHPIIMGRKTFASIGRPLPNRINIIVTRDNDFKAPGCVTAHSLEEAIAAARKTGQDEKKEIFIIGGGEIYRQAMRFTDKLYLTLVDDSPPNADTFFPEYPEFKNIIKEEKKSYNGINYKFVELIK